LDKKVRAGKTQIFVGCILLLCLASWGLQTYFSHGRHRNLLTAAYIIGVIKLQYYQPVSVGHLWNAYWRTGTIPGMLKILNDPYTRFLPKEEYSEMRKETEGVFGGIGIFFVPQKVELQISAVIDGSPSDKAGLRSGDRIIAIEKKSVTQLGIKTAIAKIKGAPGTRIRLRIARGEGKNRSEFAVMLTRAIIRIPTVKMKFKQGNSFGKYAQIKISQFAETTAADLQRELGRVNKEKSCKGIILDLRGNPGGELDAAIGVAGMFLPKGTPILHIVNKNKTVAKVESQTGNQQQLTLPMVVLVDNWSASASEIVAGALKDRKRAVLVGTHTFGKDLIQQITELPGGPAVSVTVASYLTSGKRNIHKKGVQPDVAIEIPGAMERFLKTGNSDRFQEMQQLQEQTAVRILREKVVTKVKSAKLAG
jgi:carboxyl-terminal processing protease